MAQPESEPRYQRKEPPFSEPGSKTADGVRFKPRPSGPPPPASDTHSSGQSDLKICLFFQEFWAFWVYALLSWSSSCSDLRVSSRHAHCPMLWALREGPVPARPRPRTPGLAPNLSPVHAGLLQGTPPVQLLVIGSEDLHREGGSGPAV